MCAKTWLRTESYGYMACVAVVQWLKTPYNTSVSRVHVHVDEYACVYACMRNIAYKIKVLEFKHYERIFEQTRSRAGEAGCRPCGGVCRGPRGVGGTWHLWWPIGRIDVELLIALSDSTPWVHHMGAG